MTSCGENRNTVQSSFSPSFTRREKYPGSANLVPFRQVRMPMWIFFMFSPAFNEMNTDGRTLVYAAATITATEKRSGKKR